jgi:hypothetical protein
MPADGLRWDPTPGCSLVPSRIIFQPLGSLTHSLTHSLGCCDPPAELGRYTSALSASVCSTLWQNSKSSFLASSSVRRPHLLWTWNTLTGLHCADAERQSSPCCIRLDVFVSSLKSGWLVILVVVEERRLCKVIKIHWEIVGFLSSVRLYYKQVCCFALTHVANASYHFFFLEVLLLKQVNPNS